MSSFEAIAMTQCAFGRPNTRQERWVTVTADDLDAARKLAPRAFQDAGWQIVGGFRILTQEEATAMTNQLWPSSDDPFEGIGLAPKE